MKNIFSFFIFKRIFFFNCLSLFDLLDNLVSPALNPSVHVCLLPVKECAFRRCRSMVHARCLYNLSILLDSYLRTYALLEVTLLDGDQKQSWELLINSLLNSFKLPVMSRQENLSIRTCYRWEAIA